MNIKRVTVEDLWPGDVISAVPVGGFCSEPLRVAGYKDEGDAIVLTLTFAGGELACEMPARWDTPVERA